jgi:hypothetical protein
MLVARLVMGRVEAIGGEGSSASGSVEFIGGID